MASELFMVYENQRVPFLITIAAGIVLALALGWLRCRRMETRRVALATVLLPLLGCFFAHLFYCLARLERVLESQSVWYLFAFWEEGHMLYGGVAGCLLALWISGGKRYALRMMDAYAPSGALMIVATRIAEGFSGQGYGDYFEGESTLCRLPFMMYDAESEMWAWALFVLEALVALGLLCALLLKKKRRQGDDTLLLLGLYAAAQIVLESLRRDEFLRWGFVRCSQVLSAVTVLIVLACYQRRSDKGRGVSKALCWAVYAAMITFCLLLEFATEGRIPFLRFLDVNGCYACMAAACAAMMGCVLWMRALGGAGMAETNEGKTLA